MTAWKEIQGEKAPKSREVGLMQVGSFSTIFQNRQNGSKTCAGVGGSVLRPKRSVLKGGKHEQDKGRHHPLQETQVSGTHREASCPGISSWVIEKCLAWHQSGSSESMALLPGFGFLRDPPGKHSRSVMTHLKNHLFHPHTEEWLYRGWVPVTPGGR